MVSHFSWEKKCSLYSIDATTNMKSGYLYLQDPVSGRPLSVHSSEARVILKKFVLTAYQTGGLFGLEKLMHAKFDNIRGFVNVVEEDATEKTRKMTSTDAQLLEQLNNLTKLKNWRTRATWKLRKSQECTIKRHHIMPHSRYSVVETPLFICKISCEQQTQAT